MWFCKSVNMIQSLESGDIWGINKFFTSITAKLYSTKIMHKYDND